MSGDEGVELGGYDVPATRLGRERGLVLSFRDDVITCRAGDVPEIMLRLTNRSGRRWQGFTSFAAWGHLLSAETGLRMPEGTGGFMSAAGRGWDLGDGESDDVPLALTTRRQGRVPAGEYLIEATFDSLGLSCTGGRLVVTERR